MERASQPRDDDKQAVSLTEVGPGVYVTNRGTVVVRGCTVTAERAGLTLPDGEGFVEVGLGILAADVLRRVEGQLGLPGAQEA